MLTKIIISQSTARRWLAKRKVERLRIVKKASADTLIVGTPSPNLRPGLVTPATISPSQEDKENPRDVVPPLTIAADVRSPLKPLRHLAMNQRQEGNLPSNINFKPGTVSLPSHVAQLQLVDPEIRCAPLWTNEDEKYFSYPQCWLRKKIETFQNPKETRRRGQKQPVEQGQVGIRCIHCKNLPEEDRGKGSTYFPSTVGSIYQSAQNMMAEHFNAESTCAIAPAGTTTRSGKGKMVWTDLAVRITGLEDTIINNKKAIKYKDP